MGFSWKRSLGVTRAKRRVATATGIPTTKSGRKRKVKRILTGGILTGKTRRRSSSANSTAAGCSGGLALLAIVVVGGCVCSGLVRSCESSPDPAATQPGRTEPLLSPPQQSTEPAQPASPPPTAVDEPDPVTEVEAAPPPPLLDGKVTARMYKQILEGMTYAQVVEIIGAEGKLKEKGLAVGGGERAVYSWDGRGDVGASFVGIFEKGVLVSKAQFNLW